MKSYVKDFLDRAVQKYTDHQNRKAAREAQTSAEGVNGQPKPEVASAATSSHGSPKAKYVTSPLDVAVSDNEDTASLESPDRKRKRENDGEDSPNLTPSDGPTQKRLREDELLGEPSPPPPPPPPPEAVMEDVIIAEQQALREQEEALMRENEEAQRLEDEANKTKELEDATKSIQKDIMHASNEISKYKHNEGRVLPQDDVAVKND